MSANLSVISSVPAVPPAKARVAAYDWGTLADELDSYGCAVLPKLLSPEECGAIAALYWNGRMRIEERYPGDHAAFLKACHDAGQTRPTPLLLQYVPGNFSCLHQDLYGDLAFPLQVAILRRRSIAARRSASLPSGASSVTAATVS